MGYPAAMPLPATLPYFTIPPLLLGPITVYPFAMAVLCGWLCALAVGSWMARRAGERLGVPALMLGVVLPFVAVAALVGQRFGLPGGLSVVPFAVLAATAVFAALLERRVPWHHLRAVVAGGLVGSAIMRIGCFVVHDHPGHPTSFVLGVAGICPGDPSAACHDLGLYDLLLLGAAAMGVLAWRRSTGMALLSVGTGELAFNGLTDHWYVIQPLGFVVAGVVLAVAERAWPPTTR